MGQRISLISMLICSQITQMKGLFIILGIHYECWCLGEMVKGTQINNIGLQLYIKYTVNLIGEICMLESHDKIDC